MDVSDGMTSHANIFSSKAGVQTLNRTDPKSYLITTKLTVKQKKYAMFPKKLNK